jgi:uncharacterized protein YyaL (SSP411 family)
MARSVFEAMWLTLALLVTPSIQWQHALTPAVFQRARTEHRFVLLDLEAVWCHWCHVMAETTYQDPAVVKLVGERYLAVRVDQDSDPALASRYQDWGWPATIILAPDGAELVKRRGYIPPPGMAALLQAVIDDPTPGPSVVQEAEVTPAHTPALDAATRTKLERRFLTAYDRKYAGWGNHHKLLGADEIEYALARGHAGDARLLAMGRATLDAALALVDPVFGGVYQYSDRIDWKGPHFEKIMEIQARALRVYALGYGELGDRRYLDAARAVERYLAEFLAQGDAFAVSQDADLSPTVDGHAYYPLDEAGRRKLGIPRVDRNLYARENGWAIGGLVALYEVSGDPKTLARAQAAARWVMAHRRSPRGGFKHGEADAPLALADSLGMGEAFLALAEATGDRAWIAEAQKAAAAIDEHFGHGRDAGYLSVESAGGPGALSAPVVRLEENVALARFANRLAQSSGDPRARPMAERAMRWAAAAALATPSSYPGLLLADHELARDPIHVTVVGSKKDTRADALHAAARRDSLQYRRIDWWDPHEPLPPGSPEFPALDDPAAFLCTPTSCSRPLSKPEALTAMLKAESGPRARVGRQGGGAGW